MDIIDVITRLINGCGLPSALVVVALVGVWKACRYLGPRAVEPLVDRGLKFIDTLEARIGDVAKDQADLKAGLKTICRYPATCQPPTAQFAALPMQRGEDK